MATVRLAEPGTYSDEPQNLWSQTYEKVRVVRFDLITQKSMGTRHVWRNGFYVDEPHEFEVKTYVPVLAGIDPFGLPLDFYDVTEEGHVIPLYSREGHSYYGSANTAPGGRMWGVGHDIEIILRDDDPLDADLVWPTKKLNSMSGDGTMCHFEVRLMVGGKLVVGYPRSTPKSRRHLPVWQAMEASLLGDMFHGRNMPSDHPLSRLIYDNTRRRGFKSVMAYDAIPEEKDLAPVANGRFAGVFEPAPEEIEKAAFPDLSGRGWATFGLDADVTTYTKVNLSRESQSAFMNNGIGPFQPARGVEAAPHNFVMVHRAKDGWRFLFALFANVRAAADHVMNQRRTADVFVLLPVRIKHTDMPKFAKPKVWMGLGRALNNAIAKVPAMAQAMAMALNEVRGQIAKLDPLGAHGRLGCILQFLRKLPKHAVVTCAETPRMTTAVGAPRRSNLSAYVGTVISDLTEVKWNLSMLGADISDRMPWNEPFEQRVSLRLLEL